MKRFNNLYDQITSFPNLYQAWRLARRRKRFKKGALDFSASLEKKLVHLSSTLKNDTWCPGVYRNFQIYQPKPRIISAAPFEDRVVHHALISVLEPLWENRFDFDSYATRKGKGSHAAVDRFQSFQQKYPYVFKGDITQFFPSIRHSILKKMVRKIIKCKSTLNLIEKIIDRGAHTGVGLPIGNLTSQFFANVFLDPLDRFIRTLGVASGYIRYMDDFCIFLESKKQHEKMAGEIRVFLDTKLSLQLKPGRSRLYACKEGIEFLGFRVFSSHRRVKNATVRRADSRLKNSLKLIKSGDSSISAHHQKIMAWLGHVSKAQTRGLLNSMGINLQKPVANESLMW